jgi:ankyrin repeat protein
MRKGVCLVIVVLLALPALLLAQAPSADPDLDLGVRLVDEGDFEEAVRKLSAAVQRLSKSGESASELSRAYLYLAIAYLQLSEEQKAKAQFVEAWKSDRSLKLSPHEFPPKVISAFKAALDEVKARSAPEERPRDPAMVPVFFEAVKAGDFPAARQLLGDDPELANEKDAVYGATPLHWAALKGNEAMVALLLAQGGDPDSRNADGETPFQVAQRGRKPEITRLLTPTTGLPGFIEAVKRGDVATVERLATERPSLVNESDSAFRATPLHWAALRGHAAVIRYLLAQGADPGARNKDGETPLDVAERAKRADAAQALRGGAGGGAAAPAPRASGNEMIEATKNGKLDRVRELLAADSSLIRATDSGYGGTPLHWAALKGHTSLVQFLLAQGADPDARNRDGETPLDVARRAGKKDIVALLER